MYLTYHKRLIIVGMNGLALLKLEVENLYVRHGGIEAGTFPSLLKSSCVATILLENPCRGKGGRRDTGGIVLEGPTKIEMRFYVGIMRRRKPEREMS